MPRTATTFDVFNAIAEPKRRDVLNLLVGRQMSVNKMVEKLQWTQPQVSKHLGVLKQVGLVKVKREGRQQLYSVQASGIKPLYDWAKTFEIFWDEQLFAFKEAAEKKPKIKTLHKGNVTYE
jgi:DNA-binding transcriptional ArsR family regulator